MKRPVERTDAGPGQHTVPRFHLQRFAHGPGRRRAPIWQYDKVHDRIDEVPVGKAGVVDDFYSWGHSGNPSGVDRPIQENENRAAPVIRRLAEFPIGTFTLTDEESWAVAIYLAILNRRVPSATATLGRQFEALREYWTIAPLEDPDLFWQGWQERGWPGGRDEAETTRLSFLAQLRDPGTKLTDADLVSLLGVGEAPFIAEQLCHMTWTVLRRTRHPRFVIGDTPAHLFAAGPSPGTLVEADDSSIRWQVPLDPGSLLVLTAPNVHPELQDQVVDADGPDPTLEPRWQTVVADAPHAEDAALFHAWVAWGVAERWVWARDKSDLDRLSDWIRDPERREPGSVRQRRTGFFRPDDPAQLRAVVKEVQARRAAMDP